MGMKEPLLRHFNNMRGNSAPPTERKIGFYGENMEQDKNSVPFPENIIVSSRYTFINFLPKSLLEQFRRLANVYFLIVGTIAAVGGLTSYYETAIEPEGILGPMAVVVMISVIKDGIEDVKRHNADARINSRPASIVREDGTVETVEWRSLQVGDILLIVGDEEIAADTVVLACGGVQGPTCYVETAAIDGETNLKMKQPALVQPPMEAPSPAIVSKAGRMSFSKEASMRMDQSVADAVGHITVSADRKHVYGLRSNFWLVLFI
jgi:magnesium-transporting ATPase (P-type)